MIESKGIKGEQIFFTDEKRFILNIPLNKQTNQIRLNKEGEKQYKNEQGEIYEKITRQVPKFPMGIMVAGGISSKGVGKLIFVTGTMGTFSYLQALEMYKEDIDRLGGNLYFQQDGAACHTSQKALKYIDDNFPKKLESWPANSPDLSPIEELWAIVEEKLSKYKINTLPELSKKLVYIWNRIPKKLCKNLVAAFDKKIEKIKNNGERANKRDGEDREKKKVSWEWKNNWNDNDNVERIIYNEVVLEKMQKKN